MPVIGMMLPFPCRAGVGRPQADAHDAHLFLAALADAWMRVVNWHDACLFLAGLGRMSSYWKEHPQKDP